MRAYSLVSLIATAGLLTGCATGDLTQADKDEQRVFDYYYEVEAVDQEELFVRARDFFAQVYTDSREVLRVQDREEGRILGRAIARWTLATNRCSLHYDIRFQSRDEKARLQLELLEGAPATSACNWHWPTKSGYQQIVTQFESVGRDLGQALESGDTFSNF